MQRNVTQCTVNVSANPPETYRFCLFFVFYSVVCLFLPSKNNQHSSFIWRLWMLECDELWCFMCRYNDNFDGICSLFDYRIGFPTRTFNSNIDRMLTALWPNVNFKLYIVFYNVFVPSCDTWILDFVHLRILQTYYLMINIVDMSLAFFPLLL